MTALPARIQAQVVADPIAWAETAKALILQTEDIDQLNEMRGQAEAVRTYLGAKLGRATEEARAASEVLLRVKRRIGDLLPPPKSHSERADARWSGDSNARRDPASIDHRRASEFRQLADVPEESFEDYLSDCRDEAKPPSTAGALAKPTTKAAEPTPAKGEADQARSQRDVATRAESLAAKLVVYLAERIDDDLGDLIPVLEKSHAQISKAHHQLAGYLSRTRNKS